MHILSISTNIDFGYKIILKVLEESMVFNRTEKTK